MHRLLNAFQGVFRVPPAVINTKFRAVMREVVEEEYPHFRCSAARAVLEGRIPGVPKPVAPIHPAWKKRVQQSLYLLDLFETICLRYIESVIREQKSEIREDARNLSFNLGSVKIPRLLETVYELDKKTGKLKKEKPSARRENKGKKDRKEGSSKEEEVEQVPV